MFRLTISGNFFLILRDSDQQEHLRHPRKDVSYIVFDEEDPNPLIRFKGLEKDLKPKLSNQLEFRFNDLRDDSGAVFADFDTLTDSFLDTNLGNSSGGGSGSGASSFSGWIDYNDASATVSLLADTWTDIPNNGAGAFSNRSPLPLAGGITELIDPLTGYLIFSDFKIGDDLFIRHDFSVVPDTNNATLEFRYFIGQTGQEYPLNISIPRLDRGSGISYQETGLFFIYMGDENTRLGGAKLQVRLSTTGTLNNNGIAIKYSIY